MQPIFKSLSMLSKGLLAVVLVFAASQLCTAQAPAEDSGTSTDLYVMLGSDFDRPGWRNSALTPIHRNS
jgi:hypothetical protein